MIHRKWIIIILFIAVSFLGLVWYFGLYGVVVSLLWSILVLVVTNIDRAADITASSYKWARNVNFWFEKNAVEKRLEATIGHASKKVNLEAGVDLLPHGIDIKWDEPHKREAFLQRGKMVVCLEPSINEERNLSRATLLYVQEDLIAPSQRFVNTSIMKSLCFALTRKILMLDRKLHALKCLNEEFVEPEIKNAPHIRGYVSGMDNIDKQGFLTRILLREFYRLDAKFSPSLTDTEARKETKALTRMVKDFVERTGEAPSTLDFKGSAFRISLMPVARLRSFDIKNFVKSASRCRDESIDSIYVFARGLNVGIAKLVVSEIQKEQLFVKNWENVYNIVGRTKGQLQCYIAEMTRV